MTRSATGSTAESVEIPVGGALLKGDLATPHQAGGLVIFAHGSGSSRRSGRNQAVAAELNRAGLATLLFDLLTDDEEIAEAETRHLRFDIGLLADRLTGVVDWSRDDGRVGGLPVGLFGASTGAAAALRTAAARPGVIHAVVSRGGRPDLAGEALPAVRAPTMLIIGGDDTPVIEMNRQAAGQIAAPCRTEIIPGATHLFEEPGALNEVSRLASEWFAGHLASPGGARP